MPTPSSASTPAEPPSSPPHTSITIHYVTYIDYSNAAINLNTNAFNTTTHTNTRSFNSSQAGTTEHRPRYDRSQQGSASEHSTNSEGSETQNTSIETSNTAAGQELGETFEGRVPSSFICCSESSQPYLAHLPTHHGESINTQHGANIRQREGGSPITSDATTETASCEVLPHHASPSEAGLENSDNGHMPINCPNVPVDIGQPRRVLEVVRGFIAKVRACLRCRWTRRLQR